jgi:hypothetical protein
MSSGTEALKGELVSLDAVVNDALTQITKAEIDQQIATAHAYPRSLSKFKNRALEMATLDEETAESCIYSRPVGKGPDGKQKFAEGMSIRMAEIVGACFGNLRVGATLIEMTPRFVKARGFAHDLETNFASTSEVVESTVKANGMPYDERMRVVVAKAALAKARRDATFQVVPKALCKAIEAAARQAAIGGATTIGKRRDAVAGWVAKLGIEPARVWASLGVAGADDLTVEHLTTLTGVKTAVKDGEVTLDEAFPPIAGEASPAASAVKSAAKKAVEKSKGKPTVVDAPSEPAKPAETPPEKAADASPAPGDAAEPTVYEGIEQAIMLTKGERSLGKIRDNLANHLEAGAITAEQADHHRDLIAARLESEVSA